jgi:acetoin utilization deacetylase AcuC-like enzyme
LHVVWSARYHVDIGRHIFPTRKYELVRDRLLAAGIIRSADLVEPEPASWDDLALVHTAGYLQELRAGTLSAEALAQLELPWSPSMVEGFRTMVGGTIAAAAIACGLEPHSRHGSPVAAHLGGGLHHAFPNHGEGFCPFNDVAVATRVIQRRGVGRVAIVDLDVHHGNGTAFIFNPRGDPPPAAGNDVFTFSMHQQHNYPMWKPRGSLDIGLPDGASGRTYLDALEAALPQVVAFKPGCLFYLAGADPYEMDQLGGLRLTLDDLRIRDRRVIAAALTSGIPLVILLAGGYAARLEDTVAIHAATVEEAARALERPRTG